MVTFLVSDPGLIWFVQCHMCFLTYSVVPVISELFLIAPLHKVDLYDPVCSPDPFHWPDCMRLLSEEWHILSGKHLILYILSRLLLKIQSNLTESTEFLSMSGNKGSNSSTWRWYCVLSVSHSVFMNLPARLIIKQIGWWRWKPFTEAEKYKVWMVLLGSIMSTNTFFNVDFFSQCTKNKGFSWRAQHPLTFRRAFWFWCGWEEEVISFSETRKERAHAKCTLYRVLQ